MMYVQLRSVEAILNQKCDALRLEADPFDHSQL